MTPLENASDQRFDNPLSMMVSQNIALMSRCDLGCQANTCTTCKVLQASHQYGQPLPIQTLLDSSRFKNKKNEKLGFVRHSQGQTQWHDKSSQNLSVKSVTSNQ